MIAEAPLVWSKIKPTHGGRFLMRTPLEGGWHVRLVLVTNPKGQANKVHTFTDQPQELFSAQFSYAQWAPCPDGLL